MVSNTTNRTILYDIFPNGIALPEVLDAPPDKLFDALIVDEAQDFEDTWWIALTEILKSPEKGVMYVFFDDNQQLYQQISNIPITSPPFPLVDNCRNTQNIHAAMQPYAIKLDGICSGGENRRN